MARVCHTLLIILLFKFYVTVVKRKHYLMDLEDNLKINTIEMQQHYRFTGR